jgi:hypothetical protein
MRHCTIYLATYCIITLLSFANYLAASPVAEKSDTSPAMRAIELPREKSAQAASPEASGTRTLVNRHPDYPEILTMLKDLVARFGKTKLNTFFISPVIHENQHERTYIYWKQDKSILILDLPLQRPLENESALWLYTGKTRIDLVTGVVSTEEEQGFSTFLVSKPWVDKILKDCVVNGRKINIHKRNRK